MSQDKSSRGRSQPPRDAKLEAEMRVLRPRFLPEFQLETDSMKCMVRHFMVLILLEEIVKGNLPCEDDTKPSLSTCFLDSDNSMSFLSTCFLDSDNNMSSKSCNEACVNDQDTLDYGSYSTDTYSSTLGREGASLPSLLEKFNLAYMEDDDLEFHMRRSKEIGRGSYGQAFLGNVNGTAAVLKQVNCDLSFCQELRSLLLVRGMQGHQQIMAVNVSNRTIVSEFAGLDLHKWIRLNRFRKTEKIPFINKTAKALLDFHALDYTHNDIKSNNICIERTRKTLKVTFIDYGIATKEGEYQGMAGSKVSFMAPEIFRGEGMSKASDVYSLGFMLNELVISGRLKKIPDEVKVWILDALKEDKAARPTLEKLVLLTHSEN